MWRFVMILDRFDVCEAWYLCLSNSHEGKGDPKYARLSRLSHHFSPRPSLCGPKDLTTNGLEIYLRLQGVELPFLEAGMEGNEIYEMWAGAYADTRVLIRADSFESAEEALLEWLDDNAPGCLTTIDYDEAAQELGYKNLADAEEQDKADEVIEHAEIDMTVVGHTTLKNGNAIASHEWGGQEWEG
jgi:hypothetical protein